MNNLREFFLLDPDVTFLNHGSFGACPIPVFETYQNWQLELERQPVEFLGRRYDQLLDDARLALANYLNADVDNLVFVPNATLGVNTVARSLPLQPGDEILATDHEYGALDYTWNFVCGKTGAKYIRHPVPLPVGTHTEFVESFWSAVTPRTKVIFISHITSPTGLIFPVEEICRRARQAGILTIVDGAHVPGHIPLDLKALDPDFYSGNCHKWLCSPKGSAFLYVRADQQPVVDPLVISWGYIENASFVQRNQWQGTRDVAAYLSVPAAIEFQAEQHWDAVRTECHALISEARTHLSELFNLPPISPDSTDWLGQMLTFPLPPCDALAVKTRLYDEFCIELPQVRWNDLPHLRISFQGYNTHDDLNRLIDALKIVFNLS